VEKDVEQAVVRAMDAKITIDRLADGLLTRAKETFDIPCKRGCSHCCNQLTISHLFEGVVLAKRLIDDRRLADLNLLQIQGRLQIFMNNSSAGTLAERTRDTASKWFAKDIPCALLKDHKCTVYDIRPIVCSSYLAIVVDGANEEDGPPTACAPPQAKDVCCVDNLRLIVEAVKLDTNFIKYLVGRTIDHPFLLPLGWMAYLGATLILQGKREFMVCLEAALETSYPNMVM